MYHLETLKCPPREQDKRPAGTSGITSTFLTPRSLPQLCAPYQRQNDNFVPTPPDFCANSGLVPMENVGPAFQPYVCAGVAPVSEDQLKRQECVLLGTPIYPSEFESMKSKAEAVVLFQSVLQKLQRFVTCSFLMEIIAVLAIHCHPLANSIKSLGTGCLLSGIGLMLTSLLICSCWRKITKPAPGKVAPGEQDKLLEQPSP